MRLKLAHELKTGDRILFATLQKEGDFKSIVSYREETVVGYVQCIGMGSYKYGEYGQLHLNDSNKTVINTFKNAPFIVEES